LAVWAASVENAGGATAEGITQASNFFTRGQPQKEAIAEPVKQNGQTE
jgi:hypothetical protein